jgi:hypothetical protein
MQDMKKRFLVKKLIADEKTVVQFVEKFFKKHMLNCYQFKKQGS